MNTSQVWIQAAKDLCLCAAFALLLWAPLGRWILRRLTGDIETATLPVSISVGMGAWALWILALGVAGALYRLPVAGSAAAVSVCAYLSLRSGGRAFGVRPTESRTLRPGERSCIAVFALLSVSCLGVVLASALAPESSFDALNVHLPYARDAALAHRAGFAPNNWSSAMPALPLMAYIQGFLFSGATLAKLFNFLCYLLCGGVIYSFARRWWGSVAAASSSLLFWSCPIAMYEGTSAMIDLPLTLFSAVAVLAFLEWASGIGKRSTATLRTSEADRPDRVNPARFLLVAGFGLGLAFGCKYHAIFWAVPILLIVSWMGFRHRPAGSGWVRQVSYSFAIFCLLALPWLVRTWAYTGNPVFPLANAVFKSSYFTPEMAQAAQAAYANEGVGRSWSALLRLPLTVTFHPGPFRGTLGFVFLVGIVFAVARAISPGKLTDRQVLVLRYGLLCSVCYFYAWALTAQEIRYLLPVAPLLAMLTAAGIMGTASSASARARIALAFGVVVIVAGSVIALPSVYPQVVREWTYWHSYQSPLAYLLGRQSAEEYLQRDVPSIYAYEYINSNLNSRNRVLLLNDANQFYSRVPTLYSFTIEGERILLQQSEDAVIEKLKESGISHVLLNYNGLAPLPGVVPRRGAYFFLEKAFQERYLEPVFSKNNVVLYKVRTS